MSTLIGPRMRMRLVIAFAFIFILSRATVVHAQSYVEGISEVLPSTTSTDLYTLTNTFISYDLAAYYSPYTAAQLLDNGTQIAYGETPSYDGVNAELDGHVPSLRIGDDYEVDGAHYLIEFYTYSDGYGNTYCENPGYYGFTDGYQSSGYDSTGGGGDYYTVESDIFLGYTASAISTEVPQITGITPSGAARDGSGQITVSGSHLVDVFDGSTTPSVLSGSGLSLSIGSLSATQVTLNYSIDANAATGARQFTLSNRFGPSEPQTFTVGDPSPVVNDVEPHIWPAGTVIPLTITGSGFGIAPTVTLAGVGVLNPSPAVTGSTDNTISTSVSISLDAPDGPAAVTVQSHGSGGNGFIQGMPGQSSSGSNAAAIAAAPAPTPQIMFQGQNISGQTNVPIYAGQQIALSVPTPSGFNIANQQWNFSDNVSGSNAVNGGFTNTNQNGPPSAATDGTGGGLELANPDPTQNLQTIYWVNPSATGTVTYTYTLDNGKQATATATFMIQGPTGSTLPSANMQQPSGSGVTFTTDKKFGLFGVAYGTGSVGITLQTNAQAPAGAGTNASYSWVQLINSIDVPFITATGEHRASVSGQTGLDGTYPYFSLTPNSTIDSPSIGLRDLASR